MNELHVLSKLVAAIGDLPAWESDELHRAYSDAVRHLRGMPPPQSMAESLRQVNTQTALETLWSCGLSPVYYTDILSAAHGVKGMVETLRGMLADPPPDVQELVMKKIGLRHVGGGIFHSETQTPNEKSEPTARLLAQVGSTDGLAVRTEG